MMIFVYLNEVSLMISMQMKVSNTNISIMTFVQLSMILANKWSSMKSMLSVSYIKVSLNDIPSSIFLFDFMV